MDILFVSSIVKEVKENTTNEYNRVTFRSFKGYVPGTETNTNPQPILGALVGTRMMDLNKSPQVGDFVPGKIVRDIPTTTYNITKDGVTRTVNKTSVVVFDDESVVEVANAQLKRNSASVLVNGKPTVEFKATPENVKLDADGKPITA